LTEESNYLFCLWQTKDSVTVVDEDGTCIVVKDYDEKRNDLMVRHCS